MTIPGASEGAVETSRTKTPHSVKDSATSIEPEKPKHASRIDIIDIRHDAVEINLKDEILNSLRPKSGPKKLPTLLLYDERGLQLFEEVGTTTRIVGSGTLGLTTIRSHTWKSTFSQMRKLMS
jgi:hypothetical protein